MTERKIQGSFPNARAGEPPRLAQVPAPIRPAAAEDEAELRRLWDEMCAEGSPEDGRRVPPFSLRVITTEGCHAFVSEKDGALVGVVYVPVGVEVADMRVVKVQALYVMPSERTKEAGAPALLNAATKFALEHNMAFLPPPGAIERVK